MENENNTPVDTQNVSNIDKKNKSEFPKKGKAKLVVFSVLALILIAAGTFFFISLFVNKNTTMHNPDSSIPTTNILTAKKLVADTTTRLQGVANAPKENQATAPIYKPSGYEFSVRPTESYGLVSSGNKEVNDSDLQKVEASLTSHGLTKIILQKGSEQAEYAARYESNSIICGLNNQIPFSPVQEGKPYMLFLGCADKSGYIDNAEVLKPYFDVYKAESKQETSNITLNPPVIKKSTIAGYSNITIGIGSSEFASAGGFAGLFYVTPDKTIHYFTGTQSEIPCSKFSTVDVKKAYLGEQCYDESKNNPTAIVTL